MLPHETVLADGPPHRVVRHEAGPHGRNGSADAPIVAKYYANSEGRQTVRTMEALYQALEGSASQSPLCVPRPLGYDAERRVLLQESAPGVRLDTLLSGTTALEALDLAGRALARLHTLEVAIGRRCNMRAHIDDLMRPHPSRLAREVPELASRIRRLLTALLDADASWSGLRREVPIHRDVHPKQLFLHARRVCLIDWDLSGRGDAALDVGNFVAYLRARRRMDESAINALLQGYAASGAADVLPRVPVYEALTYMRLSCKRFRLAEPGWRDECGELISRAENCLR